MSKSITHYHEFWPIYLQAHRDPRSRLCHFLGSVTAVICLALAAITRDWRFLIAAPLAGYSAAWFGHFVFEHNRPATFGHPVWSLFSDFRMLSLWLSGRLGLAMGRQGEEHGQSG